MPNNSIYILTGEIHSGKTTAITNWLASRNDVYGILTPAINGKRFFVDAHTNEQFDMEAFEDEAEILEIGRFKFSSNNFRKASDILKKSMNNNGWLIVDEIGPLELQQKGFYEVLKQILAIDNDQTKKLLVVRQSLVEEVISSFGIKDCKVITSLEDL